MDDLINRRYSAKRRIAPDTERIVVFFTAEHIMKSFGASTGHIAARAMPDGTSRLNINIGHNPETLERWSDLRTELERLSLLTLPTEAKTDFACRKKVIVRDAEAKRVANALATAWQTRWVKLLSDTDILVTRPATLIEPRGSLTHYVVRVRAHVVRQDGSQTLETDLFDVLWCVVIQGGHSCKVQIDYIGEANDWLLHAINELNEIFHTDTVGTRHKGSIHELSTDRAALIIGDAVRNLDHDLFSILINEEPGGRWVWSVYYGTDERKPLIGEITAGPSRGVGFASAAMARTLKRDPELMSMTPRERDEIGQFGRLVTRILDMGAFEAETVLPAIDARKRAVDIPVNQSAIPFEINLLFNGTPYQFWTVANTHRSVLLNDIDWATDFDLHPERPDQNMVHVEVCFRDNERDIDTIDATLRGDGYTSLRGSLWYQGHIPAWKRILAFLKDEGWLIQLDAEDVIRSEDTATTNLDTVISETSGGVNVDANNVTIGNDMVGRDKISNITTLQISPCSLIWKAPDYLKSNT